MGFLDELKDKAEESGTRHKRIWSRQGRERGRIENVKDLRW